MIDNLLPMHSDPPDQPPPSLARTAGSGAPARDRSFERLPRPGDLHLPAGPDPVAAMVIVLLGAAMLVGATLLILLLHSIGY